MDANSLRIARVIIKHGIYLGNALSPLLFCIGLKPLHHTVRKSRYGCKVKSGVTIRHLLCMNDFKLYAKKVTHRITDQPHRIYSKNIEMSDVTCLDKCRHVVVKRGKIIWTKGRSYQGTN